MRDFRLMAAPIYRGFVARKYGGRRIIPRQSEMYWLMEGRRFVKWLQWRDDVGKSLNRRSLGRGQAPSTSRREL